MGWIDVEDHGRKSHHKKNGVDWDFEKWKYLEDFSSKP
jgi:hypothetical protein